jgi:hypothetical protein
MRLATHPCSGEAEAKVASSTDSDGNQGDAITKPYRPYPGRLDRQQLGNKTVEERPTQAGYKKKTVPITSSCRYSPELEPAVKLKSARHEQTSDCAQV